ncbi:DUF481 domain-containing protein [Chlorobium sp. N1]|uniref:DUF481 domain-containing protein n=1 Tax=Chlorobium sp. N1 TaxID=2491138 RepID=UPI001F617ACA|nr:DUF481 domain-containing protein [Chlorobium sp. N1]
MNHPTPPFRPPARISFRRTLCFSILSTLLLAATTGSALADSVLIKNGDRLSGTVVKMEGGVLRLDTGYAGTVPIAWSEVREVATDKPMKILLEDGRIEQSALLVQAGSAPVSQINPEAWVTGDGYLFKGEAALSLNIDRGNTRSDEADVDTRMEWRHRRHRLRLSGELEYDTTDRETTNDRWYVQAKYDYIATPLRYYGLKVDFKTDRIAGLDLRFAGGPYLGLQFIRTPETRLSTELGTDLVTERFTAEPDNNYMAGSWSVDFSHRLWTDAITFYHRQKGLVNVNSLSGVVLDTWTGMKVPIKGGFSTSAELQADYSGDSAAGIDPWDLTYRLKFGYDW